MRDDHDLHAAFALLERVADQAEQAEQAPRPDPRRWVKPVTVAASVAAVAALAAGALAIEHTSSHDTAGRSTRTATHSAPPTSRAESTTAPTTPPTQHERPLHMMPWRRLAVTIDAPGLAIAGTLLSDDYQTVDLVGRSGSYIVRVFTDKAPRPYLAADAEPITVNGRPGVYATLAADPDGSQRGVAWQYAPGAWASVAKLGPPIGKRQGIALAASVHVGRESVARTPVAFTKGTGLRTDLWLTGYGNDRRRAGQHGYSEWNALYNLHLGRANLVVTADDIPGSLSTGGDKVVVNGHRALVNVTAMRREVSIDYDGHAVDVIEDPEQDIGGKFRLSRAQLLAVARSIVLVNHPADPTTWLDAQAALPN